MASRKVVLTITSGYHAPFGSNWDYFTSAMKTFFVQKGGWNVISVGKAVYPDKNAFGKVVSTITMTALTRHSKEHLVNTASAIYQNYVNQKSERTEILGGHVEIFSDAIDNVKAPVVKTPVIKQPVKTTTNPKAATPTQTPTTPTPLVTEQNTIDLFGSQVPYGFAALGGLLLLVILLKR